MVIMSIVFRKRWMAQNFRMKLSNCNFGLFFMKKWDTDLLYHNYYYLTAALVKEQLTVQDNTTRVWGNYVLLFTNDSNSALLGGDYE